MSGDSDLGFWGRLGGSLLTGLAILFGVWKHTQRRIDRAYELIGTKADEKEMDFQRQNIRSLFQEQKSDREAVMTELRNTNELLGQIHVGLTRELLSRPTRDEVERMIEKGRAA